MPLPTSMHVLNANKEDVKVTFKAPKRPVGFEPTPEYNPTRIVVACVTCKSTGCVEFYAGFDLKAADQLMAGKPIWGECYSLECHGATRELIPVAMTEDRKKEFMLQWDMQRTMDVYTKNRWALPANGSIVPFGRLKKYGLTGPGP